MTDKLVAFRNYRTIEDMRKADQELIKVEAQIEALRLKFESAMEILSERRSEVLTYYDESLDEYENEIIDIVLEAGRSIEAYGIEAKYVKGRKSVSYKGACAEANVPKSIINRNTKYGDPKVTIKVV